MLGTVPAPPVIEVTSWPDGRKLVRATWTDGRRRLVLLEPWSPILQDPAELAGLVARLRRTR